MRDNKIGPAGLDVLSEVLKINRGLTSLDLGSNPLGAATPAMEKLKDALAVNKTVKELSVSSVGLSSEACVTLAEALPLSSLSRLDLTFNPIDVAGMMAIAASLKENSTVSEIEVVPVLKQNRDGGGRLVEVGWARVVDHLRHYSLTLLTIGGSSVHEASGRHCGAVREDGCQNQRGGRREAQGD